MSSVDEEGDVSIPTDKREHTAGVMQLYSSLEGEKSRKIGQRRRSEKQIAGDALLVDDMSSDDWPNG